MQPLGDYILGRTVHAQFNTRALSGDPATLTGGTVAVYRDSDPTETTEGVTLTVDRDARTGLHLVEVDTGADPEFYLAGSDYALVLTAGTVDGVSVAGVELASFSLENRTAVEATEAVSDVQDTLGAFEPGSSVASEIGRVSGKLGAFSLIGSHNNVADYLRALLSKQAPRPDELAANSWTADPATDSLEALRDTLATASAQTAVSNQVSTVLNRLGAFTGSGVNTVLGFLRALGRKDAAAPSDLGGTYDPATDALEALRDRGDSAWGAGAVPTAAAIAEGVWEHETRTVTQTAAELAAAVTGSKLVLTRCVAFSATLTGLTVPADRLKTYFSLKATVSDVDAAAWLQIEETAGLVRLNGLAGEAEQASLTVDAEAGTVTIAVTGAAMAELEAKAALVYDLKVIDAGGEPRLLTSGAAEIAAVVTRAVE